MGAYLTYALDEGGSSVHVDAVPKGLKCGCHCPNCNGLLYAKNGGMVREHHFAHAKGHECEGAYESMLHILAKEILQESGSIMLPYNEGPYVLSGSVQIHDVEIEKWDEQYGIRPDAEAIMENGERLLIEFYVSHKVDGRKRKIIVDNHLKCLEIDINYQSLDKAGLKDFLINSTEDREWIIPKVHIPKNDDSWNSYGRNPKFDKIRNMLKEVFETKTLIIYPFWNRGYDLKQIKYDVCEVNTKYRGIKADLLLYRSQEEDKGQICICIRGRCRNYNSKLPSGVRIIDIIIRNNARMDYLKAGYIINEYQYGIDIEFYGFREK